MESYHQAMVKTNYQAKEQSLDEKIIPFSAGIGKTYLDAEKALFDIKNNSYNKRNLYNIRYYNDSLKNNSETFSKYGSLIDSDSIISAINLYNDFYFINHLRVTNPNDERNLIKLKQHLDSLLRDKKTGLMTKVGFAYDYLTKHGIDDNSIISKEYLSSVLGYDQSDISRIEKLIENNPNYNSDADSNIETYFLFLDGNGMHEMNEKYGYEYVTNLLNVSAKALSHAIRNERKLNDIALNLKDFIRIHESAGDEFVAVLYSNKKLKEVELKKITKRILDQVYDEQRDFINSNNLETEKELTGNLNYSENKGIYA